MALWKLQLEPTNEPIRRHTNTVAQSVVDCWPKVVVDWVFPVSRKTTAQSPDLPLTPVHWHMA
jgi:hypothetical protein